MTRKRKKQPRTRLENCRLRKIGFSKEGWLHLQEDRVSFSAQFDSGIDLEFLEIPIWVSDISKLTCRRPTILNLIRFGYGFWQYDIKLIEKSSHSLLIPKEESPYLDKWATEHNIVLNIKNRL